MRTTMPLARAVQRRPVSESCGAVRPGALAVAPKGQLDTDLVRGLCLEDLCCWCAVHMKHWS